MSGYYKDEHRYDDIINLPHHQSAHRPHMSLHDRAAQFAPFAALNGHNAAIEETARLTDEEMLLDENTIEIINSRLSEIAHNISEKKTVAITYFRQDLLKKGGAYLTDLGVIKKIDEASRTVIMESGMKIPMEQIADLEVVK